MKQEPQPKRSMTTAVLFILLTMSLVGNVFLFAHYLQEQQQERAEQGEQAFLLWKETKEELDKAIQAFGKLKEGAAPEKERVSLLLGLGPDGAGQGLGDIPLDKLFETARSRSADWPDSAGKDAAEFVQLMKKTALEGSADELQKMAGALAELKQLADSVDTSIGSRERYLTLLADKSWPDAARRMADAVDGYK
ncbi:hypothetical protein NYE40_15165 [Paenibacillus sp. FSL W8-1187]|uniref:hypothetical protein n=1 Tax=Paenibacillus TaxID=44249 RepID=UPI0004245372|nr:MULTISPECIES: hypothetical protein [Paenibacillus]QGG56949.1 hypothetical protein GE073_16065 [Paenibacillus sp. B01]